MKECNNWIMTYTGRHFFPLDPRQQDISIVDIAHALSNVCRYTGHGRFFYSVAHHSILAAWALPKEHQLWGLLHDASEAYISDISTPVKHSVAMIEYRKIEKKLSASIYNRFGLTGQEPEQVKETDVRLLRTEAEQLGLFSDDWGYSNIKPFEYLKITELSIAYVRELFLRTYTDLTGDTSWRYDLKRAEQSC